MSDANDPGVFSISTSILIEAQAEIVWNVLCDCTKYPEWNPFVRSQSVTEVSGAALEDQTLVPGKYLAMSVHIPPTMDDHVKTQRARCIITAIDSNKYRAEWRAALLPSWLLRSYRVQSLTVQQGAGGFTLYESKEVFGGLLANVVKWHLQSSLQKSFNAMAEALKERAEKFQANSK